MRCYRMTLAYDGTDYSGWQIQPETSTVQGAMESALRRILGEPVRLVASGRTDAGVHARGQVVSFRCSTRLTPEVLCRALNANTPEDIYVQQVRVAPDDFHAIRDAIAKRYRYVIQDSAPRDLFSRAFSWCIPHSLNVAHMQEAAGYLIGRHDFRSFEAAGAPRKTTVRTVSELTVERQQRETHCPLVVDIRADGFLYNMVRNIVGSLVLVGRGERPADWIQDVLNARDRTLAGPTAPASGLTLWEVQYAR